MNVRTLKFMVLMAGLVSAACVATRVVASSPGGSPVTPESGALLMSGRTNGLSVAEEPEPPTARPERAEPALAPVPEAAWELSNPALREVIDLLRSGVEDAVLMKYVQTSTNLFNIGSEEIIFLTDLGASGEIIGAMMDRDEELKAGATTATAETNNDEPWPPAGEVVEAPASTTVYETGPADDGETVSVDYFYSYLAPYGTWVDVPEYGLCWQPTVGVSIAGWRPYGDCGRWVYSDSGWYWYSDYSWGWAVFHYGRWFHNTRWGWCWVPGVVWGPSWVSWRYSAPYCGWAPLPPYSRSGFYFSVGVSWGIPSWCYTYVPSYRICVDAPRKYALSYTEARHIHGRSHLRNRYTVGRRHRIENRGISPEELTQNPDTDIRRAKLTEREHRPFRQGRGEALEQNTGTLSVYRPRRTERVTRSTDAAMSRERPRAGTRVYQGTQTDLTRTTDRVERTVRSAEPNSVDRRNNMGTRPASDSRSARTGRIPSRATEVVAERQANGGRVTSDRPSPASTSRTYIRSGSVVRSTTESRREVTPVTRVRPTQPITRPTTSRTVPSTSPGVSRRLPPRETPRPVITPPARTTTVQPPTRSLTTPRTPPASAPVVRPVSPPSRPSPTVRPTRTSRLPARAQPAPASAPVRAVTPNTSQNSRRSPPSRSNNRSGGEGP